MRADSKPANVSLITRASKNFNYQYNLPENKGQNPTLSPCLPPRSNKDMDDHVILKNVVTIQNKGFNMPNAELLMFDGNPLNYWRFINNFETNIASETINRRKRLAYISHPDCKGEARNVIENCSILDSEDGYIRARDILERQFGRPHVIAQLHIKLVINGLQIRPMDGLALQSITCEKALDKMGRSEDLNNGETLP